VKRQKRILEFGSVEENPMKAMIFAVALFMSVLFCCVASAQLTKVILGNNAISGNARPERLGEGKGSGRDA
jgi:hypothetical protein